MEDAAPVTTLCGQLAALKTQTLHVKPGQRENDEPKPFTGTVKTVARVGLSGAELKVRSTE